MYITSLDRQSSLLPYFVYEVFEGVHPDDEVHSYLVAVFKSEELAQDFINYQETISSGKFIIEYRYKTASETGERHEKP